MNSFQSILAYILKYQFDGRLGFDYYYKKTLMKGFLIYFKERVNKTLSYVTWSYWLWSNLLPFLTSNPMISQQMAFRPISNDICW